jgi:hypothetical protein
VAKAEAGAEAKTEARVEDDQLLARTRKAGSRAEAGEPGAVWRFDPILTARKILS